jgi:hypothetical protein
MARKQGFRFEDERIAINMGDPNAQLRNEKPKKT